MIRADEHEERKKKRKQRLIRIISVGTGCVLAITLGAAGVKVGAGLERERLKLALERERLERAHDRQLERERQRGGWWRHMLGTVVSVAVKLALDVAVKSITGGGGPGGGSCMSRDCTTRTVNVLYNDNQVNFIGGNNQLLSNR